MSENIILRVVLRLNPPSNTPLDAYLYQAGVLHGYQHGENMLFHVLYYCSQIHSRAEHCAEYFQVAMRPESPV